MTDEAALNDIVDALGDRIFTLEGLWVNGKKKLCYIKKKKNLARLYVSHDQN